MRARRSAFARFAFGLVAIAIAALACRQGPPVNDPKPEPNSPLPNVEKHDNNDTKGPTAPSLLKGDAG